jgi:hypothetical protein
MQLTIDLKEKRIQEAPDLNLWTTRFARDCGCRKARYVINVHTSINTAIRTFKGVA